MPISSLILEVAPGQEEQVARLVRELPGADVDRIGQGALVVVTDTSGAAEDRELCENLSRLPEVTAANVVFSDMEDCL